MGPNCYIMTSVYLKRIYQSNTNKDCRNQRGNAPLPPPPSRFWKKKSGGWGADFAPYVTNFLPLNSRPSYGPGANKPTTEWGHYEYLSILRGLHIDDNYIALYT